MTDKLDKLHEIVEGRIPDDVAVLLGIVESLIDLERRQDVIVDKMYQVSQELTKHVEAPAPAAPTPNVQSLLTTILDLKLRIDKLEQEAKPKPKWATEEVVATDKAATRWTGKYDKGGHKIYRKAPKGTYCRNCAKTLKPSQRLFCSRRCAKVWRDQHPGMLATPRYQIEENKFRAKVTAGEGVEVLAGATV